MHKPTRLLNRNYVLLKQGQLISNIGSSLSRVALIMWIIDVTNSATFMGSVMMAASVTTNIMLLISGPIADRYSRKSIVILCDMAYGILTLIIAGTLQLHLQDTKLILLAVFLFSIGMAMVDALFIAAINAFQLDLIPADKVSRANAFETVTLEASMMIGKGFGGILYRLLGLPFVLSIDGITFLFSALSESFIKCQSCKPKDKVDNWHNRLKQLFADTAAGFSYIWQQSRLRIPLLFFSCMNFLLTPVYTILPFFVKDTRFLNATADWYGYILAAHSIGTMAGYWFTAFLLPNNRRSGLAIIASTILLAASYCGLAFLRQPWAALALISGIGFLLGMINNYTYTMFQTTFAENMRARAISVTTSISMALSPVAFGLGGVIADALNQRMDILFCGCSAVMMIITICGCLNKQYRQFMMGCRD